MLIWGGISTRGRSPTVSVAGAYWISSITASRWTTAPGVAATLAPMSKGRGSTWDGMPPLLTRSRARFRSPLTRFWPRVWIVRLMAAGLPARVFVGAAASVSSDSAKSARSAVGRSRSDRSTSVRSWEETSR